ncbi:hypothetical protein D9757_004907 [Collybiopsis confluens]|uniref:Nuclear segregation protein Bfr1 n=1 Tax=Collybiopsis confluens TaxID=2823264 RepID=A0A8H5HTR8_9AGAR|nr:hypothetical protein D9757_004907 [Collybiopsis confluens]
MTPQLKTPSGATTPVKDAASVDLPGGGKPDKKAYEAEQERLKGEIDAIQVKLTAAKDKISIATKGGAGNERRNALRAELDEIRGKQSNSKASRGKILDQVKAHNESINKKIEDLKAAKSKISFKSVAELDAHVRNLEKQVDSGTLKLADEKRALAEISSSKRNRRTLDAFQTDQQSIEAERAAINELKKQLDDPEFKATSDRYDTIKQELDTLKKEDDALYANRSKLFEERDGLQAQINALYNERREATQNYRESNDRYWSKVNEDRTRRAERVRAQRAAEELQKKQEIAERMREDAETPAFQAQIEDCQTLIDALSGKTSGNITLKSGPLVERQELDGVAKLDIRKVEEVPEGAIVRKKKGDDDDAYFVGGKGKKGKKSQGKTNGAPEGSQLNLPFATLSALLNFSIPPPISSADLPRVMENLKTKKEWFEANQARQTAANIAKAEAEIQRLTGAGKDVGPPDAIDVTPPNGGGERPASPAPTPSVSGPSSLAVPGDEVVEKLGAVSETETAVES